MSHERKPLYQQVMIVTGATTDLGVATVRRGVEKGMKVFMIDQDGDALQVIQDEMREKGFDTAYSVADVSEVEQLQFAADQCLQTFGTFDTWVNIPGKTIVPEKQQFATHFWGMVNGSNIAVSTFKKQRGTIINVASAFRSESSPNQHIDSASREALKGYTDALRKDLRNSEIPVEIFLLVAATPEAVSEGVIRRAQGSPSLFNQFFSHGNIPGDKSLVAKGAGGLAMAGGMTFFLLRKFRVI